MKENQWRRRIATQTVMRVTKRGGGPLLWAVVACLILSFLLFSMGLKEVVVHAIHAYMHDNPLELVGAAVSALDKFLLGMVTLVFGLGSYELFFGGSSSIKRPSWLKIKSIDDLEQKVGEIVVAVMVVNLLEGSIHMSYR